ncbi:MAG: hypothetical protein R3F19_14995 [Verrucomicrobiales bacterium]
MRSVSKCSTPRPWDESSWVPPVGIAHAEADYQQKGFPITAAFDGKSDQGGWAVDGNTRFDASTALFTLAEPIAPKSPVRVRLIHNYGSSHAIGRFSLLPVDGTSPVPSSIRDVPWRSIGTSAATPTKWRSPAISRSVTVTRHCHP